MCAREAPLQVRQRSKPTRPPTRKSGALLSPLQTTVLANSRLTYRAAVRVSICATVPRPTKDEDQPLRLARSVLSPCWAMWRRRRQGWQAGRTRQGYRGWGRLSCVARQACSLRWNGERTRTSQKKGGGPWVVFYAARPFKIGCSSSSTARCCVRTWLFGLLYLLLLATS